MLTPLVLEALDLLVEDASAITADIHSFGGSSEDLLGATTGDGHTVELSEQGVGEEGGAGRILDVCLEDEIAAVGSEGLGDLTPRVGRQLTSLTATCWHDVDVDARGVAVGGVGDLLAIG